MSDGLYRTIFGAAPDGIIVVDGNGVITEVNPAAHDIFGYDQGELLGQGVDVLVPDGLRAGHAELRERYATAPTSRPMGAGLELRGRRKDDTELPVEISLNTLVRDGELAIIANVRDVTEWRRLRDFGVGSLRASEEERERIARELHDDTAQHLAALLVRLKLVERAGFESEWGEAVAGVRDELLACAEGVRRIARGLRPPELKDAGVVAAIRAHLRAVNETRCLRTTFDADPVDPLLTEDGKLVLYRIVQEAVSNAVRHSGGAEVEVRVRRNGTHVDAEIVDDGHGFDAGMTASGGQRGLGLMGMRERAHMLGGRMSIESGPEAGTRVHVRIPVGSNKG
ncbi:MAG TPA: PAS domain S-box protein [Longimicrobiales bacterium]|jgi:PAS domain S-box-containing protein